jgi:hypothetical protein
MKHHTHTTAAILTTVLLATTAFTVRADERNISEKTRDAARDTKNAIVNAAHDAGRAARIGWHKTKEFLSDDLPLYHQGAQATLATLGREIFAVKARTPESAPAYFRTRLLALDQQHEHLAKHVGLVTSDGVRERGFGPRHDFDRCVADLESAIDQAANGADMFMIMVKK